MIEFRFDDDFCGGDDEEEPYCASFVNFEDKEDLQLLLKGIEVELDAATLIHVLRQFSLQIKLKDSWTIHRRYPAFSYVLMDRDSDRRVGWHKCKALKEAISTYRQWLEEKDE